MMLTFATQTFKSDSELPVGAPLTRELPQQNDSVAAMVLPGDLHRCALVTGDARGGGQPGGGERRAFHEIPRNDWKQFFWARTFALIVARTTGAEQGLHGK